MAHSAPTLKYRTAAPPRGNLLGRLLAWLVSWLVGLVLLAGVVGWQYEQAYQQRVFEGVSVNGVMLGGLTASQAAAVLQERLPSPTGQQLVLRAGAESWTAGATDLGIRLDAAKSAEQAFNLGREGTDLQQWMTRFALWRGANPQPIEPVYTRDPVSIDALLTQIANAVALDPRDAAVTVQGLSVSAIPAAPGRQLDLDASRERVAEAIAANERAVDLVVVERAPHIIGSEAAAEKARALLASPLVLTLEQPEYRQEGGGYVPTTERRQWMVDRARLSEMLMIFGQPTDSGQYTLDVRLKPDLLRDELATVAASVARDVRDARFDYDPNTGALTPLVVSQHGLRLDREASFAAIQQAIENGQSEVPLSVTVIPPRVATEDASKFNITGLAVQGFSDYTGSGPERVVNVGVAAEQYHGVVIPPGGIFSFNEHLGWVVDATGYEEGYIISGNKTEVDVGGGVCQVSTTVFRAAIYAGFEIVERHPHAYRVPYYENGSPLGFDATIFSPYVDLKFRNNTENYYLMEVENNPAANTLAINLYGPPTGRQVEVVSTTVETIPHGPAIYEDDPALAAGETKQVDWEHDGAKIKLEQIIRDASGTVIGTNTYWSDYRPWQARYLVGTGAP